MEAPQTKRVLHQPLTPQHTDPTIASLATLGMRIRKSVADGYQVAPEQQYHGHQSPYGTSNYTSFARTPLPSHMDQPPALSSGGSTFQSGLNVSEWGQSLSEWGSVNVTTLPTGTKRGRDGDVVVRPTYDEFVAQGGLRFDEDF